MLRYLMLNLILFCVQSPHKYAAIVFSTSVVLKIPRFFHFQLNNNGTDYQTAPLMEDATYIWINAYWDDLMVTGIVPLIVLIYFNLQIYLRVSNYLVLVTIAFMVQNMSKNTNSQGYIIFYSSKFLLSQVYVICYLCSK